MLPVALITRPAQDSGELAARLRALGFVPEVAPLFEVVRRAVVVPPDVQAILVTSGNAIASLPATSVPLFAVGDATAARARAAGFAAVHSARGDAAALAALVAGALRPAGGRLFLASGAGQGAGLAAALRGGGFRVVRRVCYEARPVRALPEVALAAIGSGSLGVAVFLSAETAATFVRLLPPECTGALTSVVALAIGKTTEDALAPLPWLRICRARTPTLDDIVALL